MKSLKAWLLIISAFIFTGMKCEKESLNETDCNGNCYIIHGRITDSLTLQGIPNVNLTIIQDARPFGVYTAVKGSTNAQGEYKLIFEGKRFERNDNYYLRISHPVFKFNPASRETTAELALHLQQVGYDVPALRNFSLLKPGIIKLHVKSDDIVNFYTLTFDYDCGRGRLRKFVDGQRKIDTTLLLTTASGIKTNIKWSKNTAAGFGPPNFDTVVVTGSDTLKYDLNVD